MKMNEIQKETIRTVRKTITEINNLLLNEKGKTGEKGGNEGYNKNLPERGKKYLFEVRERLVYATKTKYIPIPKGKIQLAPKQQMEIRIYPNVYDTPAGCTHIFLEEFKSEGFWIYGNNLREALTRMCDNIEETYKEQCNRLNKP